MVTIRVESLLVGREDKHDGPFLRLRSAHLRNQRADGSVSRDYICDYVIRPMGQDAVVVVAWHRRGASVEVLLRDGLRPALQLGRDVAAAPLPEESRLMVTELVAGILETTDHGRDGLLRRASLELWEEGGLRASPDAGVVLGAGSLPSPGCLVEKFYFVAMEVDPEAQHPPPGDGSPMEEGATSRWMLLDEAIAACVSGEIADAKTELGLRRLRDHLATAVSAAAAASA
jgi:ADP-ribose pyrophosphatase